MAEAATCPYNLRSREEVVELPVQLQLSDDTRFMSDLLANNKDNGQVSDTDSSIDEHDCEALVNSPSTSVTNAGSDQNPAIGGSVSQQMINMQILQQLQSLGQRLDNMEEKSCKKTSDQAKVKNKTVKTKKVKNSETPVTVASQSKHLATVPDLNTLRQDALIQLKVEERLKQLQENDKPGKIKSLRGGAVEVLVQNKVKWPHEYVLSGSSKERVSYDQLSVLQWVAGFCRIMKEEKNSDSKDFMLDYLVSLLDDAQDFSWEAAKASHAVLLCRMEQGEVANYSQVEKIDRIRRANAQRHTHPSSHSQFHKKNFQKTQKAMPCHYFNQGTCSHTKSHDTRGVRYNHVCSVCFSSGKMFPHPEIECKNKLKKISTSKNE